MDVLHIKVKFCVVRRPFFNGGRTVPTRNYAETVFLGTIPFSASATHIECEVRATNTTNAQY